jgi:hypothetical protein
LAIWQKANPPAPPFPALGYYYCLTGWHLLGCLYLSASVCLLLFLPNCQIAKPISKVLRMKKKKREEQTVLAEGLFQALAIWQFGKSQPARHLRPPALVSLGACLALLLPDWLASAGLSIPLRFCLSALSLSCFCQIAKLPSPFQKFSE